MSDEGFIEDFSKQMEAAIQTILFAIQNLAERNSKRTEADADQRRQQQEDGMSEIRPKLILHLI